jgi:hypothetical protein
MLTTLSHIDGTVSNSSMPKLPTPMVFLDANIVIAAGKPPGGPMIARIADLVEAELITVLTTDLSVTEISKKHAENDFEVVKDVGRAHFRKIVEEVTGVKLPEITKTQMRAKLATAYNTTTKAMFTKLKAKTLAIDEVKPSAVFAAYAAGEGFFSGEGKKDQFPDAFIFECLKSEASKEQPVIIVSNDGDYSKPVSYEEHISLVKSLPELFKVLGLQIEVPEIDGFLKDNTEALVEAADRELADWGLIADVDDAEIDDTTVLEVELYEKASFKPSEDGGSILVVGRMTITAYVSYTHPNWDEAMYDSEDKVLIPFEDVSGDTEVVLRVDVSMLISVNEKGDPNKIEELRFRNSDFQFIELYSDDPYEYK